MLGVGQQQPTLAQHFLVAAQVQQLAVCDHAVEVEDDGGERARQRTTVTSALRSRSPARMGTASRFSDGGNGHSCSSL